LLDGPVQELYKRPRTGQVKTQVLGNASGEEFRQGVFHAAQYRCDDDEQLSDDTETSEHADRAKNPGLAYTEFR
jgi:hypothetical protein